MAASLRQRVSLALALLAVLVVLLLVSPGCSERLERPGAPTVAGRNRYSLASPLLRHRMLLQQEQLGEEGVGDGGGEGGGGEGTNRIGGGGCSKDNVMVYQAATSPLPNGIPTYTVQVINSCLGMGCGGPHGGIAQVHLSCGWFSSARTINPKVFRRLGFDDCLVNDGRAIPAGGVVSFQYANTFPYKLSVASVSCQSPNNDP